MNDNNWRRVESRSIEQLVDRVLVWIIILVLLGVIAYCAVTAKPLCSMGAAAVVVLSGILRSRWGSDP